MCSRYTTAYAESDYTDRDSEKEEGDREPEQESEEDERSCATVVTLRQEDSGEEEDEESEIVEEVVVAEDGRGLDLSRVPPNGELALLLAQSDILHTGDAALKAEGFHLLLANQAEVSAVVRLPPDNSVRFIFDSSPLLGLSRCLRT